MSEKALNARKKPILLRSFHSRAQRFFVILVCICLLSSLVFPASAAEYDRYYSYEDLFHTIKVDGDNVIISVAVPDDCITFQFKNNDLYKTKTYEDGPNLWIECEEFTSYEIRIFAFSDYKFDILDFPKDTVFKFDVAITDSFEVSCTGPKLRSAVYYYDVNGKQISHEGTDSDITGLRSSYSLSHQMNRPEGAHFSTFSVKLMDFVPEEDFHGRIEVTNFTLSMSVSDLYWMQVETGKTNAILSEVKKQLEENGQKLEDVIDKIDQNGDKLDDANDKLDDANDKLDELPGEIGDEIQGVIDNEKQEAEGSGNKFVDQILDALPDPSTEVLAALKGLTDATSYTGTDAVLPIPAIVLPGIDGLFPETVIWEGAELDFGEYMNILPPSLLSLVRSLFTIAIVLFCVYELKGIISYCLTLRENKGG